MASKRYGFCISGLKEPQGQIRVRDLLRVLEALVKAAESATILLATGEGRRAPGPKLAWLKAATDFRVTGLEPGSTKLAIEASPLVDAPGSPFGQQGLCPRPIEIGTDDTSLDLAAGAIQEAQLPDSPGDRFDDSVLDAILDLGKSVQGRDVAYSLTPERAQGRETVLAPDACRRIAARKSAIPAPKGCIVTGRIDQITHVKRQFQIEPDTGPRLYGRLHADVEDVEVLRPLWGRHATIQGVVQYKANGQPRFIEARHISASQPGDRLFDAVPEPDRRTPSADGRARSPGPGATRPIDLVGTWPGNEPIDELLRALRSDVR